MNLYKDFFLWCYQKGIPFETAKSVFNFVDEQCSSKLNDLNAWKADAMERIADLEKENLALRKELAGGIFQMRELEFERLLRKSRKENLTQQELLVLQVILIEAGKVINEEKKKHA